MLVAYFKMLYPYVYSICFIKPSIINIIYKSVLSLTEIINHIEDNSLRNTINI